MTPRHPFDNDVYRTIYITASETSYPATPGNAMLPSPTQATYEALRGAVTTKEKTMLSNADMKANRYYRWAEARRKHREIVRHLQSGGKVIVSTYTRATVFKREHVEMFRATKAGLFVRSGKRWDCLNFSNIRLTA